VNAPVAEELGLEQVLGNGGAVHLDELRLRSRAALVDDTGDEPLARPRLAREEDGGQLLGSSLTCEEDANLLPKRHHARALADQLVAEVHGALIIDRGTLEIQSPPDTRGREHGG